MTSDPDSETSGTDTPQDPQPIYSGGLAALVDDFETKMRPFDGADSLLPHGDTDLKTCWSKTVVKPRWQWRKAPRYSAKRKYLELQSEMAGSPEIFLLHAFLIANLRRRAPPPQASLLFQRLWSEQGERLAQELPVRWLISATTTFADCGATPAQRACGMGLSVMIDMIKLHDSERRFSGRSGSEPFNWLKSGRKIPISFDLAPYSILKGDLDRNMIARLARLCDADPVIRPLGHRLLHLTLHERRSIFARFQELRRRAQAKKAPKVEAR